MKHQRCKYRILVTVITMLTSMAMYAQQILFKPLPFLDNLSLNSIFTLYQDDIGYIWIGTQDGLARYDGYSLQWFTNRYTSLPLVGGNDVRAINEDSKYIWVGSATGITLIDKTNYLTRPLLEKNSPIGTVQDMKRGSNDQMWICIDENVIRCDNEVGILAKYSLPAHPNCLFYDRDSTLWVGCQDGYILRYSAGTDQFKPMPWRMDTKNIYRIADDNHRNLWLATWGHGLWRFDPSATHEEQMYTSCQIVNPVRGVPERVFYDIVQDDYMGYLWALSHFRLYVLEIGEDGSLKPVELPKSGAQHYDFTMTYSKILKDNHGNLWLGAFDEGRIVNFDTEDVQNFILEDLEPKIGLEPNVIYFNKDKNGIIWFDQSRFGLCLYNEATGEVRLPGDASLYSIDVGIIRPDSGNGMWLGGREVFLRQIWHACQEDMKLKIIEEINLDTIGEDIGGMLAIQQDTCHNLRILTENSLLYRKAGAHQFEISRYPIADVRCAELLSDNTLWICSDLSTGVITADMQHHSERPLPEGILSDGEYFVHSCHDFMNRVWLSTNLGRVVMINPTTDEISDCTNLCGLDGDMILNLVIDVPTQNLFVIFSKYIVRIDLNGKLPNFMYSVKDENIDIPSFRLGASFVDKDGYFYAGGHRGYVKIKVPNNEIADEDISVRITDVKSHGQSLFFNNADSHQHNSLSHVRIPSNHDNIEIHLSSFQYFDSHNIRYAYKMEGVDKDWVYLEDGRNVAHYNHLPKGKHKFLVKCTNHMQHWVGGSSALIVERQPAWYETWQASLVYILVFFGLVGATSYLYLQRLARRNKIRFQRELMHLKINYFTNISHELLTPLTVIKCATDVLRKESPNSQPVETITSNTTRLRRLIQQILDFWRVENGKMRLSVDNGDITAMLQGSLECNFKPLAQAKGVTFSTSVQHEMQGYIDKDKIDKILFNLVSNAVKYTPAGQGVVVICQIINMDGKNCLQIKVIDEGIGIDHKELPKIFTKFYTNPNNSDIESNGIGLSLTKELVELHHGEIMVDSKLGQGSVFTVLIPLDKNEYTADELIQSDGETSVNQDGSEDSISENDNDKTTILFIDDNTDLLAMMSSLYSGEQNVITVVSGAEGLRFLQSTSIDIIVCDLMMPGMDGWEFCQKVKEDPCTSHIPIIMLTAKNTPEDRARSYRSGVDSFITKPFDTQVLKARIDNLLQASQYRYQKFQTEQQIDIKALGLHSADEVLMQKAVECVERNIMDSDFDIVKMADQLCMSRSTLTRKIKALTGLTPLDFVYNIKLKYACTLLTPESSIQDVAYNLGFNSPKYFSKCFKKAFGMTPSQYQQNNSKPTLVADEVLDH